MENLCSHDRRLTNKTVTMNRMRMEDGKNAKKDKKIEFYVHGTVHLYI